MATTTLTNGTKIPERASRDWYSDLSTNWYLLDNHLGDTGSHLDDGLAPKATADASGNTITSTYATKTELSALSDTVGTKANDNAVVHKTGAETIAGAKTFSDTLTSANVVPSATDTYSLGSASYQYNAVYGATYYYNGTQWGLDQENMWTKANTYSKTITVEKNTDTGNFLVLKNTVAELGSTPASATPVTVAFQDKNNDNLGYMGMYYGTDGSNLFRLYIRNKYTSGAPSTTGSVDYAYFGLKLNADKSKEGILNAPFRPYNTNSYDLGTTDYKWKTLNGVNPGALSLPSKSRDPIDTTGWDLTGATANTYTSALDGWAYFFAGRGSLTNVYVVVSGYYTKVSSEASESSARVTFPVIAGVAYAVTTKAAALEAYFMPCQGNV